MTDQLTDDIASQDLTEDQAQVAKNNHEEPFDKAVRKNNHIISINSEKPFQNKPISPQRSKGISQDETPHPELDSETDTRYVSKEIFDKRQTPPEVKPDDIKYRDRNIPQEEL